MGDWFLVELALRDVTESVSTSSEVSGGREVEGDK
jgi:hypothetical protein